MKIGDAIKVKFMIYLDPCKRNEKKRKINNMWIITPLVVIKRCEKPIDKKVKIAPSNFVKQNKKEKRKAESKIEGKILLFH